MTWYYKSHTGAEFGPVSPIELLDLIRNGTVLRDTLVKKDDSQWVRVEEVNGLLANAAKPSIAYFCPTCGKQVSKPPCRCHRCDLHVDKATQKLMQHDLDEIDRKARKSMAKAKVSAKDDRKASEPKAHNNDVDRVAVGGSSSSNSVVAESSAKGKFGANWLSWLRKER